MKNLRSILIIPTLILLSSFAIAHGGIAPEQILKKVDEIRCPDEDYIASVTVSSYKPNRSVQTANYEVRSHGRERTVVEILQLSSSHGRYVLMRDDDYWAFFPEVSQPVRIVAQERLLGDVFNGDITRTNFFGDYDAKILRVESSKRKKYNVLELQAKGAGATYGKIILWVEQDKFWPLKAEFYALSGRFLKTCYYENYKKLAGKMRPSRLVMRDAIIKDQYSVLEFNSIDLGKIPEKYFSKEYLKKKVF